MIVSNPDTFFYIAVTIFALVSIMIYLVKGMISKDSFNKIALFDVIVGIVAFILFLKKFL